MKHARITKCGPIRTPLLRVPRTPGRRARSPKPPLEVEIREVSFAAPLGQLLHDWAVGERLVLRNLNQEFGGKWFRLVTRLDRSPPPAANISTAHCLAFDGDDLVLALHTSRDWTIPGGHLEPGESAEEAMHREAREEAGITVTDPILFAHEEIDPHDGVAADPKYPVPAFQVFYVARLVAQGRITALDECTEARLFSPVEVRSIDGWPQRNLPLYEAALTIARAEFVL